MSFLLALRAEMLKQAQNDYKLADLDLSNFDKKLRQVTGENDSFIITLNSSNNNPKNKEKVILITTLLKESNGSKDELDELRLLRDKYKNIQDQTSKTLSNSNQIKLNEIYEIIADIEKFKGDIPKQLDQLDKIDDEIEERKTRWREFIANTEAKGKLINELLSLIPLMRDKYERLCKNCNFCNNSINGFFLVNQKIQENEHYQTNEAPCLKREQLKLQMGDFEDKKAGYGSQIDKLEAYNEAELKNTDSDTIQTLINQSTDLIKHLDADIHELEGIVSYLKEERKDFNDGDIYSNNDRIKQEITNHDSRLKSLITEFETIKETVQTANISNPKLVDSLRIVEDNIIKSSDLINSISREYNEVNKDITSENMSSAKLLTLAHIIERLGMISENLVQLNIILTETEEIFTELQSDLIEIHYVKRLSDLKNHLSILLERLKRLNDLIDKLIELSKSLEGYTSDNEEEVFVNDLENELLQVKRQHSNAEDQLHTIKDEIDQVLTALKESNGSIDESKIEELERAINDTSGIVEGIERLVDSKIQRFADMDPYKKFMRRQKEHRKLNIILEDRETMINELKRDASSDLNNPDASDDLKQVCAEVLDELDPLEEEFDSIKQRLHLLGSDIDAYLEKSAKTEMTIEEIFELLYANVEIKKKLKLMLTTIDEFSKTISEIRKKYLFKRAESPVKKVYKAAKGDEVDQMLGDWLNTHGCEFEIKRLGGGFYMFGEKKIFAKIINGKLIIRVGGGYMNIDEFMKHYGLLELARGQRVYKMEYESLNYDELMSNDDDLSQPESRNEVMGIAQAKKNLRGSFKGSPGKGGSPINKQGSPRAGGTFKKRTGSPKLGQNRPGSPKSSFKSTNMPSAAKIEESLRKMEKDAKEGKLKDGYKATTFKR